MSDDELEGATASAYFTEDDEPLAMTGSAFPTDDMDVEPVVAGPADESDDETEQAAGFPITVDLDASGNGSTHVGVFQRDIVSVELDEVPQTCLWVSDHPSAIGVAVIEVHGAPVRLKPVSGIVISK